MRYEVIQAIQEAVGDTSASEFAARLGISAPQLCRVKNGQRRMSQALLIALLRLAPTAALQAMLLQAWLGAGFEAVADEGAVRITRSQ